MREWLMLIISAIICAPYFILLYRIFWQQYTRRTKALCAILLIAVTGLQLTGHYAPLLSRVPNINISQDHDHNGGQSSDASIVFVREQETPSDKTPDCYKRPHYVLGILSAIVGALCLGLAMGFFGSPIRNANDMRRAGFFYLGVIVLSVCFWFVYHAFALIEFKVAPCI